jgi:hypothetical protein
MLVMRHAVQLSIAAGHLFGTYHEQPASGYRPEVRPGLVLLSFGQQPRSWVGDLGVAIADRVALAGYPAFRFDMPGLGDSPGDLPVHLEVLWRDIQTGSHQALAERPVPQAVGRISAERGGRGWFLRRSGDGPLFNQ